MEGSSQHSEDQVIREYLAEERQKDKQKYRDKVSEVNDFALSLGLFRDILKAKTRPRKCFWIALAIFSLGMCIGQLNTLFGDFISAPSNTRISYHVNNSIRFPIITVCTYARVNASKMRELNVSNELLTYMLSVFKGMYLFYNNFNIRQRQEELEQKYKTFLSQQKPNFTLTNFFTVNGFDCKQFLSGCMFQSTDFDCCGGEEILSEVGKCFELRREKFPSQTIPGPSGGMRVHIRNFAEEYPKTLVNSNPDMGIQIHIIHPDDKSTLIGSSPVVIFPGTHAMINLKARHQILRPTTKNVSCTNTKSLQYFSTYTYEGCFKECIANMTMKTCGCVQIGAISNYMLLAEKELCSPELASVCVQPLLQANNMGFLWDIYDINTNCKCPIPCKQWAYDRTVSYSSVPSPRNEVKNSMRVRGNYRRAIKNTSMNSQTIIVDIFFGNLVYTKIEQVPLMDFTYFVSQLGGSLSMWLGIRLVTIVHVLYYGGMVVFEIFPVWYKRARKWQNESWKYATEMAQRMSSISRKASTKIKRPDKQVSTGQIQT